MSDDTGEMTGTITVNDDDIKLAHSGETRVRLRYWQDGSFEILSVYVENWEVPIGARRRVKLNFTIEGPPECFIFADEADKNKMAQWIVENYNSYYLIKLLECKGGHNFRTVALQALKAVAPRYFTEVTFMFWTEGGRIVRHRILPRHPRMTVIRDDLEYEGQRTHDV